MGLLAGVNYDPAAAVTKATSAAQAMTAMDTVNLRCTFTVPASGKVLVHQSGVLHGATTVPAILLGVMNGATVVGRKSPMMGTAGTLAASSFVPIEASYLVAGLAPGTSVSLDAAWGVETGVAST